MPLNVSGEPVDFRFPVGAGREASDYAIYVSFRLTPEELATNRRARR